MEVIDDRARIKPHYFYFWMRSRETPSQRNKTLPLKKNSEMRSANRIKISRKGLPKDFFNSCLEQSFMRSNKTRCKTQSYSS
jgi:hypothetical protein